MSPPRDGCWLSRVARGRVTPKKSSMASVVPWGVRVGAAAVLVGSREIGSAKGACVPVIVRASRSMSAEDEARRQLPWTVEVEVIIVKKTKGWGRSRRGGASEVVIYTRPREEAIQPHGPRGPTRKTEATQSTGK